MGTRVGRSTLFGIPLQQQWSHGNSGDFAPTYYLQTDAPLYYYSFTDAYIASAYRSLTPAEQARFDPMITGFNPADMYGVDHIRRVLTDVPRRLHRHRRVHHPQGVRLVEDRRRDGQPHQPRARSHPRLRRRGRARRDPAQRHRHAVRQDRRRAGVPGADEEPAQAAPEDHDHLGARRPRPHRPSGEGLGGGRGALASQLEIVETMLTDPAFAHVTSTSRGTRSRSTPSRRRRSIARVARIAQPLSDRFLFGTDKVAPAAPRRTTRSSTCGRRCGPAHARGEPQGAQGQLRAPLRRRTAAGPRVGTGPRAMTARVRQGATIMRRRSTDRAIGSFWLATALLIAAGAATARAQNYGTAPIAGAASAAAGGATTPPRPHPRPSPRSRSTASPCSTSATTSSRSTRTGSTRCA